MSSVLQPDAAPTPQIKKLNLAWPLILLVGLTLVRGILYLSIFPPFLAPDESAHFEAIRLIGQEKVWPTAEVYAVTPMHPEMVSTFENFRLWNLVGLYSPTRHWGLNTNLFIDYYPTQIAGSEVIADSYLMLYHLSLAPLAAALASFDLTTQLYLLRFISVLFAGLTVVVAWSTLRLAFPEEETLALAATSFIVFWPMHTHVDASVNADGLVELFSSLFFLVLVQIYRHGVSLVRLTLLLGCLGLAILTKPTGFFLLPTLAAAAIIYPRRRSPGRAKRYLAGKMNWPRFVSGTLLALMVVFAFLGSILLHVNSGGGRRLFSLFAEAPVLPAWSNYFNPAALKLYLSGFNFAVISFAGLFGWSNIHIPWSWVRVWAGVLVIMGGGVMMFIYQNLVRSGSKPDASQVLGVGVQGLAPLPYIPKIWDRPSKHLRLDSRQREIVLIFLLALIFSFIGVVTPLIATQSPSWGIHSRYYFPAIIPLSLFLFGGFQQLLPGSSRRFALPAWVIGWIAYDSLVLVWVVLPYLYG